MCEKAEEENHQGDRVIDQSWRRRQKKVSGNPSIDSVLDGRMANQDKCHPERKMVVEGELAVYLTTGD